MGRLASVLGFARRAITRSGSPELHTAEVRAEAAPGDAGTADHMTPAGIDSAPLPGDTSVLLSVPGIGREVAIGYADTSAAGLSAPGEVRIYSRDSKGAPQAILRLLADGSVALEAPQGLSVVGDMTISGELSVTGAATLESTLDVGGDVTATGAVTATEVTAGTTSLTKHVHNITAVASPSGPPV